jgi:hypothetical protein
VYLYHSILHNVLHVDRCINSVLYLTLCFLYISVSTSFLTSLCVTCRSVYFHHSILHSVLHVDQGIYIVLFFTLCYTEINVSKSFYATLFIYISISQLTIRQSLLHVDQCIYILLCFTLCFMWNSVSTPYYSWKCVASRSVYLHLSWFHSVLHGDQCI